MARERIFAAIDVGTTKVCTLIGMEGPTGKLTVLGTGIQPSHGLRKGSVVNIPETTAAVTSSLEQAERQAGIHVGSALVGVTGSHIESKNHRVSWDGSLKRRTVTRDDLERVVRATSNIAVAPTRELLHVIPRSYVLDGQGGVRNPIGMHAQTLDVETHLITGARGPVENLVRAVEGAGVKVQALVLEPLASSEAVLTRDEKEIGVALIDIGGGTSDMTIFHQGAIWHTAVIPVGGYQFTNDLSIALGIPYAEAERLKVTFGHTTPEDVDRNEALPCNGFQDTQVDVLRREVCQVLRDRCSELFYLVRRQASETGLDILPPGGFVFTGGSATLPGLESLAREILPGRVRVGSPTQLDGAGDALESPAYATAVGMLLWSIRHFPNMHRRHNGHHRSFSERLRSLILNMVRSR